MLDLTANTSQRGPDRLSLNIGEYKGEALNDGGIYVNVEGRTSNCPVVCFEVGYRCTIALAIQRSG